MKKKYAILYFFSFISASIYAQCGPTINCPSNISVNNISGSCAAVVTYPAATATTTCGSTTNIFSEDFQLGIGGWTLNVNTGTNAAAPNSWEVNASEGGVTPPGCGVASNGDLTLHITCTSIFCGSLITGAVYDAGKTSNKRAESPTINTTGYSDLTLKFNFISNGEGSNDNASVVYNDGSGWQVLTASIKSPICGDGQGQWTSYSATLPASCDNNPNLKIGFNWTNNNDNIGTDPSVAINDITVSKIVSVPPTITYDYPSGTSFPIGITTVTATATDVLNNTASCTFLVNVIDNELPVINSCPGNVTIAANNAGCTSIANWTAPTATDNCAGTTLTSNYAIGSTFPLGTTMVTYTAIDASGNSASCNFNVTVNNTLSSTSTVNDVQCFGSSTGSAILNISGGQAPFGYLWSPTGGTTNTETNLPAGNYSCTITDANGCTAVDLITVNTLNPLPVVSINSSVGTLECEGSLDTLVVGGALTYLWNTGSTNDTIVVTQTPGTTQWIATGTDGNGCSNSDTINTTISPLTAITLNTNSISILCVSAGLVNLTGVGSPAGGTWTGPGVSAMTFDPSIAGVGIHTLTYSVTNSNNCTSSSNATITVTVCTGINNISNTDLTIIYPNPNNGNFTIQSATDGVYTIIDELGQTVESFKVYANDYTKNITNLNTGIYFIIGSTKNNNTITRQRVVVTK